MHNASLIGVGELNLKIGIEFKEIPEIIFGRLC